LVLFFLQFLEAVGYYGKVWLPARSIVDATLAARKEVDPSGEILQLKQFCPWKEHLYELEEEHKVEPKIKYVLYEVRGIACCASQFTLYSPGASVYFTGNVLRECVTCVFCSTGISS
jgi:uncharacterized UPF0160 family protein